MTRKIDHFPAEIEALPAFDGPFDAFRLAATGGDVLFATYPAGTTIAAHHHATNNVGVITKGELELTVGNTTTRYGPGDWYRVAAGVEHGAHFAVDTAEIEIWFET